MELKKTITSGLVDLDITATLSTTEDVMLKTVWATRNFPTGATTVIELTRIIKAIPTLQDLIEDLFTEEDIEAAKQESIHKYGKVIYHD